MIPDGIGDAHGLVHQPAGIGIGHQRVARLQNGPHRPDPLDVLVGLAADFQLKAAIALFAIARDVLRHLGRRALRDRPVQSEVVPVPATQQMRDRQPGLLAENVPAGEIDGRLHVRMPLQHGVHVAVEREELRRVLAKQRGPQLGEAGSHARGVGRQIHRAERADFAVASEAGVGFHADDRAVENGHALSFRPAIVPLFQRQVDLVGGEAGDLHEQNEKSELGGTAWPTGNALMSRIASVGQAVEASCGSHCLAD